MDNFSFDLGFIAATIIVNAIWIATTLLMSRRLR